jgi:GT2 family glycosyltransferase
MSDPAFRISVIIPTYSRPDRLQNCLTSLSQQNYPRSGFEVIVVDDGGPESLDGLVEPLREHINVRLIGKSNGGPGSARNVGADAARGIILAFTDDDCCPCPDWLRNLDGRFRQSEAKMVGGRTVNALSRNPYATTSQLIVDAVYAFYNADANKPTFFASNNLAVAASHFRKLAGFDMQFRLASEDRDFCDRWCHQGYPSVYAPEVVVYHAHTLNFRSFCRQHFNYGRGAWRYHRVRAQRGTGSMKADMKFHAHLPSLFRKPMLRLKPSMMPRVILLLLVWQVCNAAGFFFEKIQGLTSRSANSSPQ